MTTKLRGYAIQCRNCNDIIFSRAQHDWKACSCYENKEGNKGCYIDGGFEPTYRVGGENPKYLILELTNVSKGVLYADWNKGINTYGFYKRGKLPKYAKIISYDEIQKDTKEQDWKELQEMIKKGALDYPNNIKYDIHVDLAKGPDRAAVLLINTDTLDKLRQANIVRGEEWYKGNPSLSYFGNELGGEAGEAQNVIKKIDRERLGMVGSRATKEQLAEELSDVIICCDLIAMKEGIDLKKAISKKFNQTSEKYGLKTKMAE